MINFTIRQSTKPNYLTDQTSCFCDIVSFFLDLFCYYFAVFNDAEQKFLIKCSQLCYF